MKKYQKSTDEIIAYNNRISNKKLDQSSQIKKYWNFFPTPQSLIEKMLEDYNHKPLPRNILEPSAGKGDIVDFIRKKAGNSGNSYPNIYCYELVPELQEILKQKNCKLLGNDFLASKPEIKFDLIVMNPPFDKGVNHILHAWDILDKGGQIIALLNQHTYYSAYNSHRLKFKTLVDQFGKVENLGSAFSDSGKVERTAKVDVIMVKLTRRANCYYQDLGINLGQYSNSQIKSCKAQYIVREIAFN
jgi:hypothetical protein